MESLSYALEGRTLLFTDDTDFPIDGLVRNKHLLRKWDGEDEVGSFEFMEPLLPNMVKKQLPGNQSSVDHKNDYSAQSASTLSSNSLMEFGSRFSSSLNKANDEKFVAPVESNGNPFSVDNSVLSSPEPSISAKRSRLTNVQSPVPTCQVFGCNKDLSSSKDYHKRHKVCDVHSKTPVVIVNGIQQRFCQQCSRFHLLAEFDEGKRSCRKRLAGHNERRRKPQFDAHLGSSYFSTGESKTSLIFSRVLPGGFFDLQYTEPSNHSTSLGLEDDAKCEQSLPKSTLCFHGVGKQYPSKNCLNAPSSSLEEFSVSSDTSSALSLLSAGSHNLSRNSEGILMAHPLISQQNHHANSLFSENLTTTHLGGSCTSEHLTPFIPNSFETPQTPLTQEPNALNLKSNPSNTVNLLELSLHLQRVEQQKYHGQVKLENGIFCDSTIT